MERNYNNKEKKTENKKKKFIKPEIKIIELGENAGIQLKYYSDTNFSDKQITEIFLGFKYGLTTEQIAEYACYEKSDEEMREKRIYLMNENAKII